MLWEFVSDGKVYGTMPFYTDGKANNPFVKMNELRRRYGLKMVCFRNKYVDLR